MVVVGLVDHCLVERCALKGWPHPLGNGVAELHLVWVYLNGGWIFCRRTTGVALGGTVVVAAEHHDVCPVNVASVYRKQTFAHRLILGETLCAILGNEVDFINVLDVDAHLLPLFVKHMTTEVGARSLLGSTPYKNVHPTLLGGIYVPP